ARGPSRPAAEPRERSSPGVGTPVQTAYRDLPADGAKSDPPTSGLAREKGGYVKRLGMSFALASVLVLVLSSSAFADERVVLVSHGDPAAACVGVGSDGQPTTLNYPSGEEEPWLTVNPREPGQLLAMWQQDRWTNGGAKVLSAGFSSNGGKSWGVTTLPFSRCAAPFHRVVSDFERGSDPWVDFGPEGTAYAVVLPFNANDNHNGVNASTSTDGGRTWSDPIMVIDDPASDPTLPGDDKQSVTADPTPPGVAYVVWDRLQNVPCPAGVQPREPETA